MVAFYTIAQQPGGFEHGVLGDSIEGAAIAILRTHDLEPIREIRLSDKNVVFEGISPMWADLDDNGEEELVPTVSDNQFGATIFVFDTEGAVLARSDPIGQGHRWRHQLAVANLGPDNRVELVDVRTPHLGQRKLLFLKTREGF